MLILQRLTAIIHKVCDLKILMLNMYVICIFLEGLFWLIWMQVIVAVLLLEMKGGLDTCTYKFKLGRQ